MSPEVTTDSVDTPVFVTSALKCDDDHAHDRRCAFRIGWRINPHMHVGAVDPHRARLQHAVLQSALRRNGARVIELPFVHGAYDSVFAKDNALLAGTPNALRALLAKPAHPVRQREQTARAAMLYTLGFDVRDAPVHGFEGGDVVMLPHGRGALLGHGFRSSPRACEPIARFLDAPVTPLLLRDPYLYHLDTALTVLDDGTALVCCEAFSLDALRTLARTPGITALVPVPRTEALAFGLNLVDLGHATIVGGNSPFVTRTLRAHRRTPVVVPLDTFQLAGGSAACLVARVHPPESVAVRRSIAA